MALSSTIVTKRFFCSKSNTSSFTNITDAFSTWFPSQKFIISEWMYVCMYVHCKILSSPNFTLLGHIPMYDVLRYWVMKEISTYMYLFDIKNQSLFFQHTSLLSIWTGLKISCPARVAQWWACRTHDLVVVSARPALGEISFRRILASHLCWSIWEK